MPELDGTANEDPPPLFETLTTKQLEAIKVATAAGFFARPQEATAEEVAQRLAISRSTFLYHLRGAEHHLFQAAFDEFDESDTETEQ